jgi:hypothetical protein
MSLDFTSLPPREKEPASARILNSWVNKIAHDNNSPQDRVSWLVASAVTIGLLQKAKGEDSQPLFLLKGGVYIERKLNLATRATKDVDTLFRGNVDEFLLAVDDCIAQAMGAFTFERTEIQVIENTPLRIKPRRFNVKIKIKGVVWRNIQVEVGFPEGNAAHIVETIDPIRLDFLGLESIDEIATISLAYQVAQKIHGSTAPPMSPEIPNTRVRDVIDLILISQEIYQATSSPELRSACVDTFTARTEERESLGFASHHWPPRIEPHPSWEPEFKVLSKRVNLSMSMDEAIKSVNAWIDLIAKT